MFVGLFQVDLTHLCPGCNYPFCDPECSADPLHFAQECGILAKISELTRGFFSEESSALLQVEAYHVVLPLRLALLRDSDPDSYFLLSKAMDHREDRMAHKE